MEKITFDIKIPVMANGVPPGRKRAKHCLFIIKDTVEVDIHKDSPDAAYVLDRPPVSPKKRGSPFNDGFRIMKKDDRFYTPIARASELQFVLNDYFCLSARVNALRNPLKIFDEMEQILRHGMTPPRDRRNQISNSSVIWPINTSSIERFASGDIKDVYKRMKIHEDRSQDLLGQFAGRDAVLTRANVTKNRIQEYVSKFHFSNGLIYAEVKEPLIRVDLRNEKIDVVMEDPGTFVNARGFPHFFHITQIDEAKQLFTDFYGELSSALPQPQVKVLNDEEVSLDRLNHPVSKSAHYALIELSKRLKHLIHIKDVPELLDHVLNFASEGDISNATTYDSIFTKVIELYDTNKKDVADHLTYDFVWSLAFHQKRVAEMSYDLHIGLPDHQLRPSV